MEAGDTLNREHDPYAALRVRDYQLFLPGNTLANLGMRMQSAAVLWEIYERTGSALHLGYVGLVQILPVIALALPAGHAADRVSRRRMIIVAEIVIALSSFGLALNSHTWGNVHAIYGFLLLTGIARAFQQPARSAFVPQLVPRERFSNAVMWNTTGFQVSSVVGPTVAGLLIAMHHSATLVYVLDGCSALLFFGTLAAIREKAVAGPQESPTLRTLLAGVDFVWRSKVILAALTLDLFAVLLGGAVALLPVYAKDILHVGPRGYGMMEAAPSIGALLVSFFLAHLPPLRHAGRTMLWCVAGFGVATVIFAISRSFPLSLLMLFFTGVFDTVSVIVRHTLVQLLTPDGMRGRVSAVNGLFIGASNELGAFESGAVANLFSERLGFGVVRGTTLSVVAGGIGTILVVMMTAVLWPDLRRYGRLGEPSEVNKPAPIAPAEAVADLEIERSADAP